jgi:hypothetical protein
VNARIQAPLRPEVLLRPEAPSGIAGPLPAGTCLQEFRLLDVVGQGGFGVVYRAEDRQLQRVVAIKEYLPAQLAARAPDGRLGPVTPHHADTFAAGLNGFLDEARLLARFRHPALLEVLRFWEQNGTAYLAMPFYPGSTLERLIEASPAGLDFASLRTMLGPLLDAVELLHQAGCVHRDIAPDNLIVRPDGSAVLLDFGAARRVIGDRVRATTVMLKAGYAPIEQYADDPSFRVGPWSDVYAIAAVLHHAITGRPPVPSPMRVMRDTRAPLAGSGLPGFDDGWLGAIDEAMAVRPEDRPQSIAAFRERLQRATPGAPRGAARAPVAGPPAPAVPATAAAAAAAAALAAVRDNPPTAHAPRALVASAVAAVVAVALGMVLWSGGGGHVDPEPDPVADVANGLEAGASLGGTGGPAAQRGARAPAVAAGPARPAAASQAAQPGVPGRAAGVPGREAARAPSGAVPAAGVAAGTAGAASPAIVTGAVRLTVLPWAEVWVDGVKRGVTPPLKSLDLPAGMHRVELRNPAADPVLRRVEVQAGQSVDVTHRFGSTP